MFQIKKYLSTYQSNRKSFLDLYRKIMIKLNQTYKEMGKTHLNLISKTSSIRYKPSVNIHHKKEGGTVIPRIIYELLQEEQLPPYSFENTSHYLDDIFILLKEFFRSLIQFAESEDACLNIGLSFKKINRRINGLENVIIPELRLDIATIKKTLEETEREGFVRLKKTKNLINKKQIIV
jgi:V/A-type H+-transporting ATPase subunit D